MDKVKQLIRKLIIEFKETSSLILMEYIRIASMTFVSGLMHPLILKVQGVEFSLALIGVISLVMKFKTIVIIMLKKISMRTRALLFIISTVISIVLNFIYFVDIHIWIICEMVSTFISAILLDLYYIEYDVILARDYDIKIFKDVQYTERILMTIAGTLGAVLSIALVAIPNSIVVLGILFGFLIELPIGLIQYKRFRVIT